MREDPSKIYDEKWFQQRREEMSTEGLHQQRYPNGKLFREWWVAEGKQNGVLREWHENGNLALEQSMKHGLVHGIVKKWNRNGRLLGEYKMEMGRGVIRDWYDDGTLQSEMEFLTDSATRAKIYDDLGHAHEVFMWNAKSLSKKKFYARLKKDQDGIK